jgi:hypothetical protein
MKLETVLFAFILLMPCFGSAKKQPNIVLIMANDMGYECLGANGGADYKTPFLDSLAHGGMRFEHAHSQPICTPSRVKNHDRHIERPQLCQIRSSRSESHYLRQPRKKG